MRVKKNKGFVLVLVIILIGIVGFYLLIVSGIMKTMQQQSNDMLIEAKLNNLVKSGEAYLNANDNLKGSMELQLNENLFKNCSLKIDVNENIGNIIVKTTVGRESKLSKTQVLLNEE